MGRGEFLGSGEDFLGLGEIQLHSIFIFYIYF